MFPPVPGPFQGSVVEGALPYVGCNPAIERAFGWLAAVVAGMVLAAIAVARVGIGWAGVLVLVCLTTIAVAAVGMWVTRKAADMPVQAWLGLLAAGPARPRAMPAGRPQLRIRLDKAWQATRLLRSDGACLADAASGIMAASARLADGTAAALDCTKLTERDVGAAADGAMRLAAAARATTVEIGRMANGAVCAAAAALAAQRGVAGLDATTAAVARAADQIEVALRAAGGGGLAAGALELAGSAEACLTEMQASVAELRAGAQEAAARMAELSDMIQIQHEIGLALGHAVAQQGMEIGAIVEHLSGACAGLATLRAGVDAVTRSGQSRLAEAEALRGAADRLPGHADAVAEILRGIPDFAPGLGL